MPNKSGFEEALRLKGELREQIQSIWPALGAKKTQKVLSYWQMLYEENQKQNLTRNILPGDFVFYHLLDVKMLLESGFLKSPALDLGSGAGIPGLLTALVSEEAWVLSESEKKKAEFMERVAGELKIPNVMVCFRRAERVLETRHFESVVSRAVGSVTKIFSLIQKCSTWNNLILFKGPAWEEEWKEFQKNKRRGEALKVVDIHAYRAGPEGKHRKIVFLNRK